MATASPWSWYFMPSFNGKKAGQMTYLWPFNSPRSPGLEPVFSLSQSHLVSLRVILEVTWKMHSQAIGKWLARGVSSSLSFFNVTWHQKLITGNIECGFDESADNNLPCVRKLLKLIPLIGSTWWWQMGPSWRSLPPAMHWGTAGQWSSSALGCVQN